MRPQPNVTSGWGEVPGPSKRWAFVLCALLAFPLIAASGKVLLKGVEIQLGQRTLIVPTALNQREGAVEYALVHRSGKVHESLLRTEIEPQDLHAAVLLVIGKLPTNGIHVEITARWTNVTGVVTQPLAQLLRYTDSGQPLEAGPWRYSGSEFFDGKFLAQTEGSILALMHDPAALANNPRRGRDRDDLWQPNTEALPAVGTPVEVLLRFTSKSPPK